MNFIIGSRSQREHSVHAIRIGFDRAAGVGLCVAYEHTGTSQWLAAQILNEAVHVLRLGPFVASARRNPKLRVGRQSH